MRLASVIGLLLAVAALMMIRRCEGSGLRRPPLDDDEDTRVLRRHYRDYAFLRPRAARADDAFDDYGHLRFGRSDD